MHENDKDLEIEVNDNIKQDDNVNDESINIETAEPEIPDIVDETVPEEPAKVEIAPVSKVKVENPTLKFLYPAIVLASISVIVALLLAVLNSFTADVIAGRKVEEQNEAIKELFGDIKTPDDVLMSAELEAPVNKIFQITSTSGGFLGYCVSVSPKGFGGAIDMLVAVNPDGEIIKVKILDISETAGIGTKVESDYFLEQFSGKKQGIAISSGADNSIDTISGATISSKAVLSGINAALDAVNSVIEESGWLIRTANDEEVNEELESESDTSETGTDENSAEGDGGQG